MNWLDNAISLVDPARAFRRVQARMALDLVRKYDGATKGRKASGWNATGGTASAEVLWGLDTLRNRSRDLVRNNEHAKKAINTLATKIVGTGITVIPDNKRERSDWMRWCEEECDAAGELDFGGLQRLAAVCWKEAGEVLVRRRWRKADDGLTIPMQLQLLEPDHLDHLKTGPVDSGNVCICGVEYDLLGRRAAYWLFPEHPGEVALVRRGTLTSKRVPASEVIHLYRKDRISQVRGVPELAVSMMRMRSYAEYEQAELVRKKIEACFTAFVTTDEPRKTIGELQKEEATGRNVEKISPGLIKYLTTGEGVTFGTPAATGGYGEYTASQLHAIAAGAGVTYHQLTGDTSRANYTSHRAATREFYDLVDAEQWLTFIPMFVRPVRRWWREAAQAAGARLGSKPDRITTPRKQMVDPLKDTTADKEEIRAGLKTLSEALRERGFDPEMVLAEIKSERELLATLGITLDIDAAVSELKQSPLDVLNATQEPKEA